jgi:hypothetical protein
MRSRPQWPLILQGILRLLRLLFVVFCKSVIYMLQVRVVQGKEPVHFMSIFDGKMIIFQVSLYI